MLDVLDEIVLPLIKDAIGEQMLARYERARAIALRREGC